LGGSQPGDGAQQWLHPIGFRSNIEDNGALGGLHVNVAALGQAETHAVAGFLLADVFLQREVVLGNPQLHVLGRFQCSPGHRAKARLGRIVIVIKHGSGV